MSQIVNDAYRNIEKAKENCIKDLIKIANDEWNKATNKLYKEALNMFKEIIRQYYWYYTKKYIRHGQDDNGTRTGINLYKAGDENHIKIIKSSDEIFNFDILEIDINSSGMEDYGTYGDDETVKAEFVWDIISGKYEDNGTGMRGVPNTGFYQPWNFEYKGKYFSVSSKSDKTNLNKTFQKFEEELLNMTISICFDKIKKRWKERIQRFKNIYDSNMKIITNYGG